jgi:hypothetical protein
MRTLAILLMLSGCGGKPEAIGIFSLGQEAGVAEKKIREASGLAASKINPGHLWTINDSGNQAEVFLLNEKAEVVMTCRFKELKNRDWEEVFIAPGPKGEPYLHVADIGDNDQRYEYKILYRFKEPSLQPGNITIDSVEAIYIRPSDKPRDSETIIYDSLDQTVYMISKHERHVWLYRMDYPFQNDTVTAEAVQQLPFRNIVSADICPKGDEVILKDYTHLYYWKRREAESLIGLFQRPPVPLDYNPEPQGEAFSFRFDDSGFYTLSETTRHAKGKLLFYTRY